MQSFACVAREKKSVVRYARAPRCRSGPTLGLDAESFFPRRGEIGIRDYVINIHVTRRVPRHRAHTVRLSTYLFGDRACTCMYVETTRGRVYSLCRWHRARRENLGTISASIQCRYTPEGNRSQVRHNLSLIASSPSSHFLRLSPSLVRARGIKYNKDIQWELIGDISTYLPFTRGALLPVHNAGMRRRCRDARFAPLPPTFYVPFLSAPQSRFFLSPPTE